MAMQKVVLVAVVAALLLLCHGADAFYLPPFKPGSKINKFCQTATSKRLCTRMVGKASNLHDASANAIKATLDMAKKVQSMNGAVIPAVSKLKGITKDSILETCHDTFENAVDDLNLALQALASDDHGTLMTRLSAAMPSDCGDSLKEFGVSFPLKNMVKYYDRYVDSALAVVTQE